MHMRCAMLNNLFMELDLWCATSEQKYQWCLAADRLRQIIGLKSVKS